MNEKKTPLKLAIVIPTSIKMGAGIERWALNIISSIDRDKFTVTLIESDYYDKQRFSNEDIERTLSGIDILKFNPPDYKFAFMRKFRISSILLDILLPPMLLFYKLLHKNRDMPWNRNYDIIYLTRNAYFTLFKDSGKILIGSSHGILSSDSLINRIYASFIRARLILRGIQVFHLYQGKDKIKTIISEKKKVFITPNPVRTPLEWNEREGVLKFLYVGRLEKIKGIDLLMKAWDQILDEEATLTIVGSGSLTEYVRDFPSKRVNFIGSVDDNTLFKEYVKADVFIYPTLWDSLPTTVLEALTNGLFIITSTIMKSTFSQEENDGFIEFILPTPTQIADSIKMAIQNKDVIRKKSQQIYTQSAKRYGIEKVSAEFSTELISIFNNKSGMKRL
ncbi:MAG: glycosyltransferase family 4 protein [Thermoplasmataceae archaeon]